MLASSVLPVRDRLSFRPQGTTVPGVESPKLKEKGKQGRSLGSQRVTSC